MKVYTITAYRHGVRDGHSYILGCFTDMYKAISHATSHHEYRGGKYACEVEECILDHFDNRDDEYVKTVFATGKIVSRYERRDSDGKS
jgi:hypothetical protein